MTKSKRFRVSQQDAASPIKASVTETVLDDDGNEVEVTRDLSGGTGAAPGAATIANADAPLDGEVLLNGSTAVLPISAPADADNHSIAQANLVSPKIIDAADEAHPRWNTWNTPESDLAGGAGNAASPAQDEDEIERRRFVIISRVRLNNQMRPVGAPVRITKSEHEQLAKAGAVDPDWEEDED
ncbi:hypothetical protein [Ensifer canadensis]